MTVLSNLGTASADLSGVVYNGKIYVFGGYGVNADNSLKKIQIYDPITDSWSYGPDLNYARWGATVEIVGNKAYIFGGASNSGGTAVIPCEIYDLINNTVSVTTDLPNGIQAQGLISTVCNDKIYVIYSGSNFEFDPTNNSFTQKAYLPYSTRWSNCVHVNVDGEDRIYVLGGYTNGASTLMSYYVPSTNSWVNLGNITPFANYGGINGVVYNGQIVFGFGQRSNGEFFNEYCLFNPKTEEWSDVHNTLLTPRDGLASVIITETLYIIGGRNLNPNPYGLDVVESIDLSSTLNPTSQVIFNDDFTESDLDASKWEINKIGTITGSISEEKYNITNISAGWIYDNTSTGSQHQAKIKLPLYCDITFDVSINDTVNAQMGQVGLGLVHPDGTMMLFVGQIDDLGANLSPKVCINSEKYPNIRDLSYSRSNNMLYKLIDPSTTTNFQIKKRHNFCSIYIDETLVSEVNLNGDLEGLSIMGASFVGYPFFTSSKIGPIVVTELNFDQDPIVPIKTDPILPNPIVSPIINPIL